MKFLWDADTHAQRPLKVLLLGSSPLLFQSGLTESLAGRFETIAVSHWFLVEMREAFGWELEQYIYFGRYPGAAALIGEPERWRRYIVDSLIETTISRDILLLTRVDKPALLRRLFHLACGYSGQVLAYQKMLGQLQDAGNTVTLAHYLELLRGAGMIAGLPKYAHGQMHQRASSPKLQVLNTALMSALAGRTPAEARQDADYWGRLVESCVGAHLLNTSMGSDLAVSYWRDRNLEVDFMLHRGKTAVAIEVKSGRRRESLSGMQAFAKRYKRPAVSGGGRAGHPVGRVFVPAGRVLAGMSFALLKIQGECPPRADHPPAGAGGVGAFVLLALVVCSAGFSRLSRGRHQCGRNGLKPGLRTESRLKPGLRAVRSAGFSLLGAHGPRAFLSRPGGQNLVGLSLREGQIPTTLPACRCIRCCKRNWPRACNRSA